VVSGRIVIMGSGEATPTMVGTHRAALEAAAARGVVILDSPFGFQENAEQLTHRLAEYFETSLAVDAAVASLRTVDAEEIEVERFRQSIRDARMVFAGPGSPSYALSVWRAHEIGPLLADVVVRGGSLTLASAAALTAGTHTIPVYEIYKVGAPPHWLEGLDLLSLIGIRAAVVPHWNNSEGGNHDTSRCYIGQRRLSELEPELDVGIIGVDEHTAATFDAARGVLEVSGKGTVTLRGRSERVFQSGTAIGFDEVVELLGDRSVAPPTSDDGPANEAGFDRALSAGDVDGVIAEMLSVESAINQDPALRAELRSMIVRLGDAAGRGLVDPREVVGGFVNLLLDLRRDARAASRYEDSDRIRDGLSQLGVEVRDTGDGQEWDFGPDAQNS
jgi:cyanophycinase-like exopeptidase